ncbi:ArnT family glycosyltransferase [Nocardioides sp. Soil777]|uniref:ArnT family glycosyltransferase n=1 Tax=Nocardioides sp. Soil777 TaxID=1736409 RepID=UPI0012FB5572|nr:hypothetical protein [Nocardioides sp. Soil777]
MVAVRAVFVAQPIRSDEGGYLHAARHWAPGEGEFVYGDFHVDRPPLLMAFFRLAALWDSDAAIRVITIPVVVAIVLATARAACLLAGQFTARWAAVVTAALMCSPALAADQADGVMFALLFVMGSIAAILHGWRAGDLRTTVGWGLVAGVLAASAPLVKQNFVDAFVFAGVLIAVSALRQPWSRTRLGALAAGFSAGTVVVVAALAAWIHLEGVAVDVMWEDVIAFRVEAGQVLAGSHHSAPMERARLLVVAAVASAAVPVLVTWLVWALRRPRSLAAEHWALLSLLGWSAIGIVLGGSYWLDYLQALAPGAGLAAAVVIAGGGTGRRLMRGLALWAAVASLGAVATTTLAYQASPRAWYPQLIGGWVADSAEEGDTMVVAYGNSQVVEAADLPTPYPYLWSLPMRTLDPEQQRLERLLDGPSRPTWFVVLNGLNSWDIDDDGRLRSLIERHYGPAATICGYDVLVRTGVERRLVEVPSCAGASGELP